MRILFTGDISFNDDYKDASASEKILFNDVESLFNSADLVVGNLECTCEGEDENILKSPRLKTNPQTLSFLKKINMGLVTLANNHIYDNLLGGFNITIDRLNDLNIKYIGASIFGFEDCSEIIDIGNTKIGFLNYVHSKTNPNLPENAGIILNVYQRDKIIDKIQRIKDKTDIIVLIFHWGMDNSYFPEPWQRRDAKAFVKAGADLIIGHHSHTIQGVEIIENAKVYYGLGNFAFSGFTHNGIRYDVNDLRHRNSLIVELNLLENGIQTSDIPIKLDGIDVVKMKSKKIKNLSLLIPFVSNKVVWPFYAFYLSFVYRIYFYFFGNKRNPWKQLLKLNLKKFKKYFK